MKKLFFIIWFVLSFGIIFSQEQKIQTKSNDISVEEILKTTIIHKDRTGVDYNWKLSNPACNGCGSFYYSIVRTPNADYDNRYWYYLLIWSNSYYGNKTLASSYITGLNIDVILADNTKHRVLESAWILALPKTQYFNGMSYAAKIWSTENDIIINVTWDKVEVY